MTRRRVAVRRSPGGRLWENTRPGEWRHVEGNWRRTYYALEYPDGWRLFHAGYEGYPVRTLRELMIQVDEEESRLLHVLAEGTT